MMQYVQWMEDQLMVKKLLSNLLMAGELKKNVVIETVVSETAIVIETVIEEIVIEIATEAENPVKDVALIVEKMAIGLEIVLMNPGGISVSIVDEVAIWLVNAEKGAVLVDL